LLFSTAFPDSRGDVKIVSATEEQAVIEVILRGTHTGVLHSPAGDSNKSITTTGEPSGDSRSGRHLFGHLRAADIDILAVGSSDWVVFAGKEGYPADEAYFLHFIIQTMAGALRGNPALDQARFDRWIKERHAQIERGELVYIAHQLDFLGQVNG
jgi:hypothetical protein